MWFTVGQLKSSQYESDVSQELSPENRTAEYVMTLFVSLRYAHRARASPWPPSAAALPVGGEVARWFAVVFLDERPAHRSCPSVTIECGM